MPSQLLFDDSQHPLVVVSAPVQWAADSVARYAELTTRLMEAGQAVALVLDLSESTLPSASVRSRLAAHRRWLFQRAQGGLVCEGVVVRSRAQQECFAIPSETNTSHPAQYFFGSLEAAISFCSARLAETGQHVLTGPPRPSGVVCKPLKKAVAEYAEEHYELPRRRLS